MRWFWFDRYLEFESGKRAVAVKNISLAEEHLHDHFPFFPIMPNSLIVEGIAQTAGLLLSEAKGFTRQVVLAKLSKAKFHRSAYPGDTLIYRVEIQDMRDDGAYISATAHIGDELQCEAEIFFAYLNGKLAHQKLFDAHHISNWLQLTKTFDVGRNADGTQLEIPPIFKS